MTWLEAAYRDSSSCGEVFHKGIQYLNQRLISQAEKHFNRALNLASIEHPCLNKYVSYLGFVRVLIGDSESITLCREAADCEIRDGDIFLNLARAELFCDNRYAAIRAIKKGLSIDFTHAGLQELFSQIGRQRKNFVPFLSRNHPINSLIGRRLRSRYR